MGARRRKSNQMSLSVIRGTGPGAFAKDGPGSVPLRRGLLESPAADPGGVPHLARFTDAGLRVWIWMLLTRCHASGLVLMDRPLARTQTGLSDRQLTRALQWLQDNPPGAPYIELIQNGNRYRPTYYRVLRDEALRGLTESDMEVRT